MLKLLAKRANALSSANFEKVHLCEQKMDEVVQEYFEELRTPNTFFCTFENAQAAQALQELKKLEFEESFLPLKRAKDPSDIQWLNRSMKRQWRILRVIILLGFTFALNIAIV